MSSVLSLAGLALAYKPPATILQIATQTFTGLAVLFPTVIFGLYLKTVFAPAAITSIICGEAALIGYYVKLLPTFGFLPVVWVILVTISVYGVVHLIMASRGAPSKIILPTWVKDPYFILLGAVFILAMDFWAWGKINPVYFGVPLWIVYFVILSAIQTVIMGMMIKREYGDR